MTTFAQQMAEFAARTNRTVDQVVQDSFVAISSAIIDGTPVGDPSLWQSPAPADYRAGTLINSWFAKLHTPATDSVRSQNRQGRGSFADVLAVAPTVPGNVVYFTSAAPYARKIELTGHSSQAPAGMVRIPVAGFPAMVARAVGVNQ